MDHFTNPILPGFYPDPSICRCGDDYYLVTTSQEFFPGIPVFHSRDLVNWKQAGHVLDRPGMVDMTTAGDGQGICAPTIRCYDGVFYISATLVKHDGDKMFIGSFICTAQDPAGPWSLPHWIEGAPGLDPSLFKDDDGRVWYHGNNWVWPAKTKAHRNIWVQEVDLSTFKFRGTPTVLLNAIDWVPRYGADGCASFDGPHIYKKDGWYYLLIAGGDTHWFHSMLIFRSKNVLGPYEPCPANPIMTHRHLVKETAEFACIGHADFVQISNGDWWAFFLGTRPYAGQYNYLGRETFLAPVDWSNEWPQVSPETGKIERHYDLPRTESRQPTTEGRERKTKNQTGCITTLGFEWNFIRTPQETWWSLTENPGHLRIKLRPARLHEMANPSFIGRRVQDLEFAATTRMLFTPQQESEEAGLVLYKGGKAFFRLVVSENRRPKTENRQPDPPGSETAPLNNGGVHASRRTRILRLIKRLVQDDRDSEIVRAAISDGPVHLRIDTHLRRYRFSWSPDGTDWQVLDRTFDVSCLSQTVYGGFTGIYVGMFAGSNGQPADNRADFNWFEYLSGPHAGTKMETD
jgi:alpha-N-arabinofuranosidase